MMRGSPLASPSILADYAARLTPTNGGSELLLAATAGVSAAAGATGSARITQQTALAFAPLAFDFAVAHRCFDLLREVMACHTQTRIFLVQPLANLVAQAAD